MHLIPNDNRISVLLSIAWHASCIKTAPEVTLGQCSAEPMIFFFLMQLLAAAVCEIHRALVYLNFIYN